MKASELNALYAVYDADGKSGLEPLLVGVRRQALVKLLDEDSAQEFLLELIPLLPVKTDNFFAWLGRRLKWRRLDQLTRDRCHEVPIPAMRDEDGEPITDEDAIDILTYRHLRSTGEMNCDIEEQRDPGLIKDPVLARAATLLLEGYSRVEVEQAIGLKPTALRKRLQRLREKKSGLPLAA